MIAAVPAWVWWWLSVLPIAQASVLRWVLMGGISTNHFLAWPSRLCPGASTAVSVSLLWGVGVVGKVAGVRGVGVVFGALLGPEATGPFCSNAGGHFWCFFCSCDRFLWLLLSALFVGCGGWGSG